MMQVFTTFQRQLEEPCWHLDPELALAEATIRMHPELVELIREPVLATGKNSSLGRQDSPTVEQVLRAAMYKEVKGLSYADLEYHQYDSKMAAVFLQLTKPFSDSTWQKYVSQVSTTELQQIFQVINRCAITEGVEDVQKLRTDTTVVETDIHYPTNNSLLWDGIRTSTKVLRQFDAKRIRRRTRDYRRQAKKNFFKINVTKDLATRQGLFRKQIQLFGRCVTQLRALLLDIQSCSNSLSEADQRRQQYLTDLLPHLETIHDVARRRELLREPVPAQEKLFSLYERHTQMIVKGKDQVLFGRKVSLTSGRSHLILHVQVWEHETDGETFEPILQDVIAAYQRVPRDVATDGAYASRHNQQVAQGLGVTNIVFNKVVGSLQNIASSQNMQTRLKKWRSGIEADISNLKRGFGLRRCAWKGDAHFQAKVFWSVIAYNPRVISRHLLHKLAQKLA